MNRFTWRQHRKQFLILGILLAAFAALTIPTGLHFWHTYQSTLAGCAQNPANPTCSDISGNLFQSNIDQILFHFVPVAILFLPILLGMFWGAPFLAREYSDGTNSLAWTQSVSRRKWLSVKLIWILAATVLFIGAFAALNTWWSNTPNTLNLNRFQYIYFATQGIVPVAYGLFAVAFGILFGAWFRKTMVAVGVALGVFIAVALIIVPNFVRTHYMAPVTVTSPMGPDTIDSRIPKGANWMLTRTVVDKNGKAISDIFPTAPAECQKIIQAAQVPGHPGAFKAMPSKTGGDPIDDCLNKAGYHQIATYQPSYRYWDFQEIESGIYLGLTAIAVAATYWLVLKRDA